MSENIQKILENKKDKQFEDTHVHLQRSYLYLINTHGEAAISELCQHAGVNRSSFYYHFKDVNDLL